MFGQDNIFTISYILPSFPNDVLQAESLTQNICVDNICLCISLQKPYTYTSLYTIVYMLELYIYIR